MTEDVQSLSTSALARKLGKSSKQMFAELEALGWIKREEDHWALTAKGTFEGGSYKESKRFGTYVVWPESVCEHRALTSPESQLMGAAALSKEVGLSAVTVNRLLHELGFIERHIKGWRLTAAGKRLEGRQTEDARSGVPYVLWPPQLLDADLFRNSVDQLLNDKADAEGYHLCLDGRRVNSDAERRIANWLYLAGISYAYHRPLPVSETAHSDFYLPAAHLYIEFWGDGDARYLAEKMRKKELYQRFGLTMIELEPQDLDDLDETLSRRLLKMGIETH